jgi:hypothetical protein
MASPHGASSEVGSDPTRSTPNTRRQLDASIESDISQIRGFSRNLADAEYNAFSVSLHRLVGLTQYCYGQHNSELNMLRWELSAC